jgi:hypothetical protein
VSQCSLCPHLLSDAGHSFDCERPWQLIYKHLIIICLEIVLFIKYREARNFTINSCMYTGISPNLCPYKDGIAMSWTAWGSNCSGGNIFFLYYIRPDWLWAPPRLLDNAHWGSFSGVKQPDRVVDQTPPFQPPVSAYIGILWSMEFSVRVGVFTTHNVRLSYSLDLYGLLGSSTPWPLFGVPFTYWKQ